ncbi:hypothetical protein GE115_07450 [Agromyces sp. CFH 90414]|uniref:HTH luxR-type domain-containing protein n=1 Tax=Agromyces agglutinans TaxID=2662258 RepID=A0A6I2F5T9_9MICO|nr:helix-turn-helix transcriptional regulator [Agromyces agglutinans]MRG59704.1 hypothetical protein [Agromyces agglutinans]
MGAGERPGRAAELDRARGLARQGATSEAWRIALEVADRAREAGDVAAMARAAVVARPHFEEPDRVRVHALAREALARLPDGEDVLRARLRAQLAATADRWSVRDWPSDAAAALAEAERLGDPDAILSALQAVRLALGDPLRSADWIEIGDRAVDLGIGTGEASAIAWGRMSRMDAFWVEGRRVELENEFSVLSGELGSRLDARTRWQLDLVRAALALHDGAFADARARIDRAVATGTASGVGPAEFFGAVFHGHLIPFLGIVDEADAAVEGFVRRAIDDGLFFAHSWLAEIYAVTDRHDAAGVEWAIIRDRLRDVPRHAPEWLISAIGTVSVCLGQRDLEYAALLYEDLTPYAGLQGTGAAHAPSFGPVSYHLARLADALGDPESAREHAEDALASARSMGSAPYQGLAHVLLARLGPDGAPHRAAAREIARRLDWARLADLADASAQGSAHGGLSAREFEVAGLLAEGLSNREIAVRLFLSERTVETHMRHILEKLAVRSRVQVAAWYRGEV